MATEVLFSEVRYFKRGFCAQFFAFLGVIALLGAVFLDFYSPAFVVAAAILFIPFLLRFETSVTDEELLMRVVPFWQKRLAVASVVGTEVTIWDGQVGFFGGYSSRNSVGGAVIATWEGDRSVGNKAVILTLDSGKETQLGTFRPKALVAALEAATGRSLRERASET
jgi:hypothetical protein